MLHRLLVLVVVSFLAVACGGDNDGNLSVKNIDDTKPNVGILSVLKPNTYYYVSGSLNIIVFETNGTDFNMHLFNPGSNTTHAQLKSKIEYSDGDRYIVMLTGGHGYYTLNSEKINNSYIVFYLRQTEQGEIKFAWATNGDALAGGRGNFISKEEAKLLAKAPDDTATFVSADGKADITKTANLWMTLKTEKENIDTSGGTYAGFLSHMQQPNKN